MNTKIIWMLTLAIIFLSGHKTYSQKITKTQTNNQKKEEKTMNDQKNKETARRLYEDCLNTRNFELIKEFVSDDFRGASNENGTEAFLKPVMAIIKAFPDVQWTIQTLIAEANRVAVKWHWTGTNTASFMDIEATGKKITNEGMAIYEFKDGKIINSDLQTDRLGFLQTMEVLPNELNNFADKKERIYFIDKFLVPANAKNEFYERANINRNFIKKLPGFIEDAAYEYTDNDGNLICVTVATWENQEALKKAKAAVQAEYQKQSFDPAEMFRRLNISADRGIYTEMKDH